MSQPSVAETMMSSQTSSSDTNAVVQELTKKVECLEKRLKDMEKEKEYSEVERMRQGKQGSVSVISATLLPGHTLVLTPSETGIFDLAKTLQWKAPSNVKVEPKNEAPTADEDEAHEPDADISTPAAPTPSTSAAAATATASSTMSSAAKTPRKYVRKTPVTRLRQSSAELAPAPKAKKPRKQVPNKGKGVQARQESAAVAAAGSNSVNEG